MKLGKLLQPPRSLKARLTLWMLVVVCACATLLALYLERVLHPGLERVLSGQQRNASLALADQIDRQIQERQLALEQVALRASPQAGKPAALQSLLDDLPVFQNLFTGGSFITDVEGVVIASYPASLPRLGMAVADRDYIAQPLATGQPFIGRPVLGRVRNIPVLAMANPIRNAGGQVTGVLVGAIDLDKPGFLNAFLGKAYGATGSLMLVSARDRIVVTGTDRDQWLAALPESGASPLLDRLLAGFEGSDIYLDSRGEEILATTKRLASADWYIVLSLPTQEVFAPAHEMLGHTMAGIALLALVSAALTWLLMRRQLAPLGNAAAALEQLTHDQLASGNVPRLAVARQDEIGTLILRFNELVDELTRQRRDLVRSETLYSTAFRTSPDAICIARLDDGVCLRANENFERMFGWTSAELASRSNATLWRRPNDRLSFVATVKRRGRCHPLEAELVTRDGRVLNTEIVAASMELDGVPCVLSVIHDITARRLAQAQIETLAYSDMLTGLPNRRRFMDQLRQAVADCASGGSQMALLCLSVDDFKVLNERLGHEKGDHILREIAKRLSATVRTGDRVARLSQEEFTVLLQDLDDDPGRAQTRALAVGELLLACLSEPMALGDLDYQGSGSAGITMLGGELGNASDFLRRADIAMAHARSQGRNRLCLFEPAMQDQLETRLSLENELRAALKSGGQLFLNYQPQVDGDGDVIGAEALVRWMHPARGLVSPGEFIQVAEDSGLIIELGAWVLQQACAQLNRWQVDARMSQFSLSVNVSSKQFEHPRFVEQVLDEVDASGIVPERLMLELTESLLVDNIDEVSAKMTALRSRGIRFALDDFGTGFSSLSYLKQLPFDELKIDQGFVRDIERDANDLAIARTVVALGDSLGLAVVAEGVETNGQREVLFSLGCRYFQGYLFSRPLPVRDFEAFATANALAVTET